MSNILALADFFKLSAKHVCSAHAQAALNLIGFSQCQPYMRKILRQQIRMIFRNVFFTLVSANWC
jgi:hypothetical protein